jgi:pyruvate dehydrogenase E2 component (dihydrolipoamide acetyltransferase)
MDIPSPVAGTVTEIRIAVGDQVSQGSLVAKVEVAEPAAGTATPAAAKAAPQTEADSVSPPKPAAPEQPDPAPPAAPRPPPSLPPAVESGDGPLPHASPAVRRFARELGADLSKISGTGTHGRILTDDVRAFIKSALSQGVTPAQPASAIPAVPEVDFARWGTIETRPLSRIKKISGRHLHRAWLNVPHVTHHDEADITELEAFRKTLKNERAYAEVRITLLGFIIKALVSAMKAFPAVNASLSPDGESLILKRYFHVGVAVDTENGLVVPVLKDVDTKGIVELAGELGEMSARARDGKLKPEEMQGGCISISSLGSIGGTGFTPIVNSPEVAILGITRAQMKPRWDGNAFEPRLMLPLDLSYDHRVIDGAEAARITAFVVSALEDSRRLLL